MTKQTNWADELDTKFPCRQAQIRALLTLYSTSPDFPLLPRMLVVHGPECTGKSTIVRRVLDVVEKRRVGGGGRGKRNAIPGASNRPSIDVEIAVMVPPAVEAVPNRRKRKNMSDDDSDDDYHGTNLSTNANPFVSTNWSSSGTEPQLQQSIGSTTASGLSMNSEAQPLNEEPESIPYPPTSSTVHAYRKRVHAIVNCRECVTGRQLFEEALRKARQAVGACVPSKLRPGASEKCDNLALLLVRLENLLGRRRRRGHQSRRLGDDDDPMDEDFLDQSVDCEELDASVCIDGNDESIPELVLVLDGIDRQREPPATLLAALTRFGEHIPKLSILLIMRSPIPPALHVTDVPHLFFPAYTRNEMVAIMSLSPQPIFSAQELDEMAESAEEERVASLGRQDQLHSMLPWGNNIAEVATSDNPSPAVPVKRGRGRPKKNGTSGLSTMPTSSSLVPAVTASASVPTSTYSPAEAAEDAAWLWPRFCAVVWDSVGKSACRDVASFRRTCRRIWPNFVQPIRDEQFGTRDFAKLVIATRTVFGTDGVGVGRLRRDDNDREHDSNNNNTDLRSGARKWDESSYNLPYFGKFLLCAAYLASYNPPRTDTTFFVRGSEGLKKRRKKRGGATAASTAAASASTPSATAGTGRRGRPRRLAAAPTRPVIDGPVSVTAVASAKNIPRTLLNPTPFPLDRLLSITMALLDQYPSPAAFSATSSDLLSQIATLSNLRLLVRSGGASASLTSSGAPILNAGRGGGGGGAGTVAASGVADGSNSAGVVVGGVPAGGAAGNADLLDPSAKWRVNFGWDFVSSLARSVGVELRDYLADEL